MAAEKAKRDESVIDDMRMLESRFCIDCVSLCPVNVADQTTWLRLPRLYIIINVYAKVEGKRSEGATNTNTARYTFFDVGVHLKVATGKPEESQPAASQSSPLILGSLVQIRRELDQVQIPRGTD
ncbi:uncharacterized protein NECHADRAFT_81983 [Fusarium vanettenii 77-13-4]|uniref:Uncharacterized protein n=1 Tax=Fusarium vanettenii (strain ATCC MYA-4622 / CBS 123669 / FGSC 9596 / NRRL 45880 / 77-13-4) TaxID=660122 RepID=C7ZA58_FUSV7|nr:uncharacterized protein NECHADRAFT_81983 [Fusarium vanettenii 77-13-4]EEU39218.1 predicted protein [Fusarium vanettenii 77-13-4]